MSRRKIKISNDIIYNEKYASTEEDDCFSYLLFVIDGNYSAMPLFMVKSIDDKNGIILVLDDISNTDILTSYTFDSRLEEIFSKDEMTFFQDFILSNRLKVRINK